MTWLFGQVWLWSAVAFLAGALITWLLFARPARRRLAELADQGPAQPALSGSHEGYLDQEDHAEPGVGPRAAPAPLAGSAPRVEPWGAEAPPEPVADHAAGPAGETAGEARRGTAPEAPVEPPTPPRPAVAGPVPGVPAADATGAVGMTEATTVIPAQHDAPGAGIGAAPEERAARPETAPREPARERTPARDRGDLGFPRPAEPTPFPSEAPPPGGESIAAALGGVEGVSPNGGSRGDRAERADHADRADRADRADQAGHAEPAGPAEPAQPRPAARRVSVPPMGFGVGREPERP
ncbi:hypothetical protein ACFFR8_05935, partial [Streptoalloteichus tenebrarius]